MLWPFESQRPLGLLILELLVFLHFLRYLVQETAECCTIVMRLLECTGELR